MRNLTLTIHFCDISQSFVSATKYENTSSNFYVQKLEISDLKLSLINSVSFIHNITYTKWLHKKKVWNVKEYCQRPERSRILLIIVWKEVN
jgi:hypothetical protein